MKVACIAFVVLTFLSTLHEVETKAILTPAASNIVAIYVLSDVRLSIQYWPSGSVEDGCISRVANESYAEFGKYGCDPPMETVINAIQVLSKRIQEESSSYGASIGVYLGSSSSADDVNNTKLAINGTAELLRDEIALHTHSFFPVLGDTDCREEYEMEYYSSEWLEDFLAPVWMELLPDGESYDSFLQNGFYSYNVFDDLMFVVLNTVLLSSKHTPDRHESIADPNMQFDFLESRLHIAEEQGKSVFILGHIPPGVEARTGEALWHEEYATALDDVVTKYPDVIKAMIFGHTHRDDFRTFYKGIPMFLVPSISPKYSSNPAFLILYVDGDDGYRLIDMESFFANLTGANDAMELSWEMGYEWQQSYGEDMDYNGLVKLLSSFKGDISPSNKALWTYLLHRFAQADDFETDATRILCSVNELKLDDYEWCVNEQGELDVIVIALTIVIFYICLLTVSFVLFWAMTIFFIVTVGRLWKNPVKHERNESEFADVLYNSLPTKPDYVVV